MHAPTLTRCATIVPTVQPPDGLASATLQAIEAGKLDEAERLLAKVAQARSDLQTWPVLLAGLLLLKRGHLGRAEARFLQAAGTAWLDGLSDRLPNAGFELRESPPEGVTDRIALDDAARSSSPPVIPMTIESARLAAFALEKAGFIRRRQDRPTEAYEAHVAAFRLRQRLGSMEEQWETAISLGLDVDLARRHHDAARWYRIADDLAGACTSEPSRRRGVSLTHLAAALCENGDVKAAVQAARSAKLRWLEHDPGCAEAVRSDLHLAQALLKRGEFLSDQEPQSARVLLREAIDLLPATRDGLLAFGSACAGDAKVCEDLNDFAGRLLASLQTPA